MTRKLYFYLLTAMLFLTLTSCSSKEEKNYTPQEITNNLLVNEQLPIKTLSNALEWPEDIILGVDLGLIELNEDGADKLKDVYEDYTDDGKDDFIKDNNKKEWSEFVKVEWVKSEITKVSEIKLSEIKKGEFKNNEIIQNKLNQFIPSYIERQTKELSSYQFSFFSKGFWGNLGQIAWMQIKSTFWGKFSNWNIYYMEPSYKIELQKKWKEIYKSYFKVRDAENEIKKIADNYQYFLVLKYNHLTKITKSKKNQHSFIFLKRSVLKQNNNINISPIINKFNIDLIDNFGLWALEILIGLLAIGFLRYLFIKVFYAEELRQHDKVNNLLLNVISTTTSPITGGFAFLGFVVNGLFYDDKIDDIDNESKSVAKNLKTFFGVALLAFSFWYIPKKQDHLETIINQNLKTNFTTQFNMDSYKIIDNLNLNTELFFISI